MNTINPSRLICCRVSAAVGVGGQVQQRTVEVLLRTRRGDAAELVWRGSAVGWVDWSDVGGDDELASRGRISHAGHPGSEQQAGLLLCCGCVQINTVTATDR